MPTSIWRVPGVAALCVMAVFGFTGYAVLLPVAPAWAVRGGADPTGAGLVGGVLLGSTVAAQGFVPAALRRFGWGPVLAVGLVLLGAPAAAMAVNADLAPLLALSAVRGIGFAVLTVAGGAAVAELVPPAQRGAGVGAYGLAIAIPNALVLPTGPWLADRLGYGPVFALAAAPVLAVPAALALARAIDRAGPHPPSTDEPRGHSARAALRLVRPTLLLVSVTLAGGGVVTFAPQMTGDAGLATAALFVLGCVAAVSRWYAGTLADRYGPERFVWPLTLATVVGLVVIGWALLDPATSTPVLLVGAAIVGVPYGALQNLTLVLAFAAVPQRRAGLASAVWNVGFDAGTGIASVLLGLLATELSFPAGIFVVAGLCAAVVPLALGRPHRPEADGLR